MSYKCLNPDARQVQKGVFAPNCQTTFSKPAKMITRAGDREIHTYVCPVCMHPNFIKIRPVKVEKRVFQFSAEQLKALGVV